MKTIAKIASVAAVALMMTLTNGCKKEEMPSGASGSDQNLQRELPAPGPGPDLSRPATVGIRMIGLDPGMYGALNLKVIGVAVRYTTKGTLPVSGWITIPIRMREMNILNFKWEFPAQIADAVIPEGTLNDVRLIFAKDGVVAYGDKTSRHVFPAVFATTTITVPVSGNIVKGHKLMIYLGFDVHQSLNYEEGVHPFVVTPMIKSLLIGNNMETNLEANNQ